MAVDYAAGPDGGVVWAHSSQGRMTILACTNCGRCVLSCGCKEEAVKMGIKRPRCWTPKGVAGVWEERCLS